MTKQILLVGLGNPGRNYENTRHNVGFRFIDYLAEKLEFPDFQDKFSGLITSKIYSGYKIFLLKPQTYMNLSGESVGKALRFYKIDLDEVVVLHDDLDLEVGRVKIKKGGGSGGHNGIKSIDQHIGKEYARFRIGTSKPTEKIDVSIYVLANFSINEEKILEEQKQILSENFNFMLDKNYAMLCSKFSLIGNKNDKKNI